MTAKYVIISSGTIQTKEEVGTITENVYSSDEFCTLAKFPEKLLIVGASPLAAEYAGILTSFGCSVTLLIRNVFLRGYDQDMVKRLESDLKRHGVRIIKNSLLAEAQKIESGRIMAKLQPIKTGDIVQDDFDAILIAGTRTGKISELNIKAAGIKLGASSKIKVNDIEQTSVSHIFAIGDVAVGRPESTIAAVQAGKMLAIRLFKGIPEKVDYSSLPYTIMTPIEYGFCGITEEEAVSKIGKDKIEVYHTSFKPLEWELIKEKENMECYTKMIVTSKPEEIIKGFHYFGPNADFVTQGFSTALTSKASKHTWDKTMGIHPTCAETLIELKYTRNAFPNAKKTGC